MSALFIAGNGFDIAHNIPSKYSDFRNYVVESYPEALELRDDKIFLEDLENLNFTEVAAEILLNTMDKAAGDDWCDFEQALAKIDFNNKFPEANHKEDETDEEDRALMQHYLLYMHALTSVFIACSEIWQEFFRVWMKKIQLNIDAKKYEPKQTLIDLFSNQKTLFFTFNYTKTLQKIYSIKKVIHIHNRVGQKLIFGHAENDIMYTENCKDISGPMFGSSDLDDLVMSFKKDTTSPLKKYADFFKKLDHSIDKVYSYGFSYGKVDSIYIKRIISAISPNATWYFTEFESKDSENLRIKKIKLRKYGFKGDFGVFKG